jgi:hypothetical protein
MTEKALPHNSSNRIYNHLLLRYHYHDRLKIFQSKLIVEVGLGIRDKCACDRSLSALGCLDCSQRFR